MGCNSSSVPETIEQPLTDGDDAEISKAPSAGSQPSQKGGAPRPATPPAKRSGSNLSKGTASKAAVEKTESQAAKPDKPDKPEMLDLLPSRGGVGTPSDVWIQASFAVQLRRLVRENPYLEPGYSAQPHPLQSLVERCRKSCEARSFSQAQKHLHRVRAGLAAEKELAAEAFHFFDHDKSGHLDEDEHRHMCAYLGWGESACSAMDLDKDGKVTLPDVQAFVGYLGGVQQLFERRSLRISTSRRDASDYSGITVGAHVRAHFYVRGQKSSMWKEAIVAAVDVEMKRFGNSGPATVGVLLEFAFGPGERWKTRQVVPMHWMLGKVEDATVMSVMKGIGMADGQQSLWALLLPDSEMQAMRKLTSSQQDALSQIRRNATEQHDAALAEVRQKFAALNYTELEVQAVLGWVQDLAPLVVHVPLDETGRFMETDEYFRNQFEIILLLNRRGKGNDEHARFGWESRLFGKAYDKAEAFERVKYGAVNILNDYKGVHDVRTFGYGDSYVVLKDVRLRTSFTFADSCCCSLSDMGTLDKYAHILNRFNSHEIHAIVAVATAQIAPESQGVHVDVGAAQLELIRGTTQDPTSDWITVGFPGLAQQSGCHYFEVLLYEGCRAPQVGVLSKDFDQRPYMTSGEGVGDDQNGWAVDGQNCARWHGGSARAWGTAWPCKPVGQVAKAGSPTGAANERALSEDVVVGVAVDLDKRTLRFATNGVWDKDVAFADIPKKTSLYPALSVRGRAAFSMGPGFRHAPPSEGRKSFGQWPGTFGGIVRIDCPELGNSQMLSGFKEYQVHGEVNLKRNVQRLVAHPKYRDKLKTERSYARLVPGHWPFSGSYRRAGALEGRALYKSMQGGVIHWDAKANLWKISETADLTKFSAWAPLGAETPLEPPRLGWMVPDEVRGVLDEGPVRAALEDLEVGADDTARILDALAVEAAPDDPSSSRKIYRVNGQKNLADELKQVKDLSTTADQVWAAATEKMQRELLAEAKMPEAATVVESSHPVITPDSWQQPVTMAGARELSVQFASKSCTIDMATALTIQAGGLDREGAGAGARVELPVLGTALKGTVEERSEGGNYWRVLLDGPEGPDAAPEPAGSFEPGAGDVVEAESASGIWYKATVEDVQVEVDWYDAKRVPVAYIIRWADGDAEDRQKVQAQLRRPRSRPSRGSLEDIPRYCYFPSLGADRYMVCRDDPKVVKASYGPSASCRTVGGEIARFGLDLAYPLAPFSIASFAGEGPAQSQGVKVGWYLDVIATMSEAAARKQFVELLQGLGGIPPLPVDDRDNDAVLKRRLDRLLDAGFKEPEELFRRLNGALLGMEGVTLHFTNSSSAQKPRVLGEAVVTYAGGQRVGSEVRRFTNTAEGAPAGQVFVDSFIKPGPAQAAGVRTDWVLDVERTAERNPSKAAAFQDGLQDNPNLLLALADVTLIFKQPNVNKTVMFTGYGPASSEKWSCKALPGSSAVFNFSARSGNDGDPALRWGVWALVLPQGAPRLSTQELDVLAEKWAEKTTKAIGMSGVVEVERDEWDADRLRALCKRHGWEFEWMTEDGERKRRANERRAFLQDAGDMSVASKSAEAAKKLQDSIKQAELAALKDDIESIEKAAQVIHAKSAGF